ncbi:uncharacterized protein [Triticum aestivum]|uniref:uncharacterized protein n=1 Tax=Triticum aestivum TaxID=4565 RepID=UPI001D0143D7|nr:uncharacterized protein LOC123178911 [Triticum aestivum]
MATVVIRHPCFSSKSMCWKERPIVREGDAAGTIADLKLLPVYLRDSAYWRGALYVGREYGFIMRINLSDDRYHVIKLPKGHKGLPRLGKSMKGVYCALIHGRCECEIWFLDESRGRMEWMLKNEIDLQSTIRKCSNKHVDDVPWVLQSRHHMDERLVENDASLKLRCYNNEAPSKGDFGWDSDDENTVDTAEWPKESDNNSPYFSCLGFHPYKEIVLFGWLDKIVAYHLNSLKVQCLGRMPHMCTDIDVAFTSAPCWMRNLPGSN